MTAQSRRQVQRVSSRHDSESEQGDAAYRQQARTAQSPAWSQQPDVTPGQAAFALFIICLVTLGGATTFIAIWINDAVA